MIIKAKTEIGSNANIVDSLGNHINNVIEFDTITKRAIVYEKIQYNKYASEFIEVECVLLDCKAFDKITGKEIM
jgi:hypothetical protein